MNENSAKARANLDEVLTESIVRSTLAYYMWVCMYVCTYVNICMCRCESSLPIGVLGFSRSMIMCWHTSPTLGTGWKY